MSLATRVLRLANSGYYAIPGGAKSIERAVTVLGIDTVVQLVYTAAVFSHYDLQSREPFSIREFWKHSLGVAMASETIARELGLKDPSLLFLSGLMHDIGKLVAFQLAKDEFIGICEFAKKERMTVLESEKSLGHPGHDEIGYELVRRWRMPVMVQEIVRHHHDTNILNGTGTTLAFPQHVGVVYLANLIVHSMKFGNSGHEIVRNPSVEVVRRVLGNDRVLLHLIKSVKHTLGRVEPVLSAMLPAEA